MTASTVLSDIHAQMRRQMNADVSAALRRHGVNYHLAFGVPSMRLREIAAAYEPSVELAESLWHEDIRESKMLATRLYPVAQMDEATARRWIDESPHDEIVDQLVMNLLARQPYAVALMLDIARAGHSRTEQYAAMKIAARIDGTALAPDDRNDIVREARRMVNADGDVALRTAALWAKDNLDVQA